MTIPTSQRALATFLFPVFLVAVMAGIHLLVVLGIGGSTEAWGNLPRHLDHPWGILTFHLRHANWAHWFANSIPLILLSGMAMTLMPKATTRAWFIIPLLSGCLLWIWGRPGAHIGASALVYGWFFFLMGMGVFHRSLGSIAAMAVALFLFSGLLWVFKAPAGVSWEGHVAGAIAGLVAAHWGRRLDHKTKNGTNQE